MITTSVLNNPYKKLSNQFKCFVSSISTFVIAMSVTDVQVDPRQCCDMEEEMATLVKNETRDIAGVFENVHQSGYTPSIHFH